MNATEKRDYIHNHLYLMDDMNLNMMYEQVKELAHASVALLPEQEQELARRETNHKTGVSQSYSWEEVKHRLANRQ